MSKVKGKRVNLRLTCLFHAHRKVEFRDKAHMGLSRSPSNFTRLDFKRLSILPNLFGRFH